MVIPEAFASEYPFESRFLDLDGLRMHYVDEGSGSPVLFVHGNPTWSFYWRRLIVALRGEHRCVAMDHVGCGLSDKPADWSYRLAGRIAHVNRLVEHLDLHDITLVVHDWGGPIGLGAALEAPERFKRLVICNTGVFDGPLPLSIKACRWPVLGPLVVRGLNGFVRAGLVRAAAAPMSGAARAGFLAPYGSWADRVAIQRFVEDIPLEPDHPSRALFLSIGERLPDLADRPALLFWGEQDFCFTTYFRDGFMERLPGAEVHSYPDAGHWVVEDKHEEMIPVLRAFLAPEQVREAAP